MNRGSQGTDPDASKQGAVDNQNDEYARLIRNLKYVRRNEVEDDNPDGDQEDREPFAVRELARE